MAHLARLEFQEQEKEKLTGQLNGILTYMDKLNEIDTEGVEPMTHATFMVTATLVALADLVWRLAVRNTALVTPVWRRAEQALVTMEVLPQDGGPATVTRRMRPPG